MRSCLGALLLGLLAGLRPASAVEDPEAQARRLQAEGAALFQVGDLLRARTAFAAARALVPERANPYRWLGLVDARLGRCDDAVPNLDEFVRRAAPGDPRLAEVRAAREACVTATTRLVVSSTPPEAEVWIDGAEGPATGRTPLERAGVAPGPHRLTLRREGHLTAAREVAVRAGETVRVEVTLTPESPPPPSSEAPRPSTQRLPPAVATAAVAPVAAPSRAPLYRAWWVWTIVGGVAAGTALGVGLGVGLGGAPSSPFDPIHVD